MATMLTSKVDSCRSLRLLGRWPLLLVFVSPPSWAEVDLSSQISFGISHTDNVALSAENEQSETVYQLIPSIDLSQASARITSDVAYQVEGYYYDKLSDSSVYHQLDADVSAALDPDNFFMELGASRSQSIIDPEASIPIGNLPISSNRANRDEAYWGPALQYAVGGSATFRASYRHTRVGYDDYEDFLGASAFVRDFDRDEADASVDNYRKQLGFSWAMRYGSEETDYGLGVPWEYKQASVELGFWTRPQARLFAVGGKETPWDDPFNSSLEDDFWEVGFARAGGEQFSAEFAVGERTYGSSKRGRLDFTFSRGSTVLSYTETPTTQGNNPYSRGGLFLPDEPEDFLARLGGTERYISKRLQWSVQTELRSTRFSLTFFDESREQRTTVDGVPLGDEQQSGVSISTSWQPGTRTGFRFTLWDSSREFAAGNALDVNTALIGADYSIGPRTRASLTYTHSEEESNQDSSGRNYEANLISLLLTRTF